MHSTVYVIYIFSIVGCIIIYNDQADSVRAD